MHIVNHSSGLKRATQKVETCGPASIVVELDISWALNFEQTNMKNSCMYSPMYCVENDPCMHSYTKQLIVTLRVHSWWQCFVLHDAGKIMTMALTLFMN